MYVQWTILLHPSEFGFAHGIEMKFCDIWICIEFRSNAWHYVANYSTRSLTKKNSTQIKLPVASSKR